MKIITAADNNFAFCLAAMLVSAIENTKNLDKLSFHVLYTDLSNENIQLIKESISIYNANVQFINVDEKIFKELYVTRNLSTTAYLRLVIPNLFINDDKVLYIDSDTIILGDIYELGEVELGENYVAAVCDENELFANAIDLSKSEYFNSGVLLMNLKKWRDDDIVKKIMYFITSENNPQNTCDQDGINYVINGKYKSLSMEWNTMISNYDFNNKTKLIHYAGNKPWWFFSNGFFEGEFSKYVNKTKYRDYYKNILDILYGRPIAVFGASNGGIYVEKFIEKWNLEVDFFIDNNIAKHGLIFNGKKVIHFEEFLKQHHEETLIFIGSDTYYKNMQQQLQNNGFVMFGTRESKLGVVYSKENDKQKNRFFGLFRI